MKESYKVRPSRLLKKSGGLLSYRDHSQGAIACAVDLAVLKQLFGSWGEHLWQLSNGIDPKLVVVDHEAKGIGHERTFDEDVIDDETMVGVVSYLSEQVARRLRRCDRLAGTVSLKYRREDFKTFSRTRTFPQPTDSTPAIYQAAVELLREMRQRQPRGVTRNPIDELDRADAVEQRIRTLPRGYRQIARRLKTSNQQEVAKSMGISKRRMNDAIQVIRAHFGTADLFQS